LKTTIPALLLGIILNKPSLDRPKRRLKKRRRRRLRSGSAGGHNRAALS
jgi:hypothetical protein